MLAQLLKRLRRAPGTARLPASVSVGMAAHGNSATTWRALDALFASATGDFELLLVDDHSPDDTLAIFRQARDWHANTRIFSFTRNLEYCESVNAFLSHARGERLIFLSNDVYASPAYLREILATAAAHPDCGILRGCSNFVDNGSAAHNVPMHGCETREAYFAFAEEVAARNRASPLLDDRFLVGDAFLVARPVIERIGTFDTRFRGYYGDGDFGLRARIAGFRVALERRAFAYHDRDANVGYLDDEEARRRKLALRHQRVAAALGEFLRKYRIPMAEASVHDLPWEELAQRRFDPALHRVAPRDYSSYLV
ncbi:MAG: glycosyltransferase [Betaproteobacteria bacterium]|nr:glycosyltransferase [Betaproteobacteria bacterium]